jgi:hypothetical protein
LNKDINHWSFVDQNNTASAGIPNKVDYLTILIHEYGHAMGHTHNNGEWGTSPQVSDYGTCGSTSNATTWNNQATMCWWGMKWLGANTVGAWGRTLHSHERTDYATNY